MRKLKLQMQMSIDGFVAGPDGDLDWMTWVWDDALKARATEIHASVDLILLGRKMTPGFMSAWEGLLDDPEQGWFAHKMVETPKIVFSRTLDKSEWQHTTIAHDTNAEIPRLKEQDGGDIIVYGGASFVASLIKDGLIDELKLFINPTAIGKGMRVFDDRQSFNLINSEAFECGIILNSYEPKR